MENGRIRMIVVGAAGIVFMAIAALMPDFPLSEETFTQGVWVLFGGLVLGEALEGAKEKLTPIWTSRKFQLLVAGLIVAVVGAFWKHSPLTEESVLMIIEFIGGIIVALGAKDGITRLQLRKR